MSSNAAQIINQIEQAISIVMSIYGFCKTIRKSDPDISSEKVIYKKNYLTIEITACLHPHDYPYYLDVVFRNKNDFSYFNQLLVLNNKNKKLEDYYLPISTDRQINESINILNEGLKIILSNKLYSDD